MGRSIRKGPWVDPRVHRKVEKALAEGSKDPIKTWARASTILPDYVGMTFMVHNGKTFWKVFEVFSGVPGDPRLLGPRKSLRIFEKNPDTQARDFWRV